MKTNLYACIFSLLLWIGNYNISFACLNLYGTNFHGEETFFETPFELNYLFKKMMSGEKFMEWNIRKNDLESSRSYNLNDWQINSDYCVALLHVGETQKAITILEDLIRKYPNEYNLNANLGTAYELSGNLEKAKFFLDKAFKINPASHHSSEWIHLKILEAKINLQKNPAWLQSNPLLGFDFGNEEEPVFSKNKDELRALGEAIEYQLSERMQFVKPKDVIVGDLLFLLGDAYGLTYDVSYAVKAYELAMEYGVSKPALLEKRIKIAEQMMLNNPLSDEPHKHKSSQKAKLNQQSITKSKKIQNTQPDYNLSYILLGTVIFAGLFGAMFFLRRPKNK